MRECRFAGAKALALLAGLGLSATMAGCSSSATTTPATGTSTAVSGTASGTASGQAAGTTVTVRENEYSLALSQATFTPGTYTFVATDTGQVTHALAISGPGLSTTQSAAISPGGSAKLTVTLEAGSYELWCPIDSHKSLGMDTHITVGAAGASASQSH
jgi:uncharacterized cupredoxin-like copper-binding protein